MRSGVKLLLPVSFLFLAGCEHTPDSGFVDDVQLGASRACGFLPTATAIASVLGLGGAADTAASVAGRICTGFTENYTGQESDDGTFSFQLEGETINGLVLSR